VVEVEVRAGVNFRADTDTGAGLLVAFAVVVVVVVVVVIIGACVWIWFCVCVCIWVWESFHLVESFLKHFNVALSWATFLVAGYVEALSVGFFAIPTTWFGTIALDLICLYDCVIGCDHVCDCMRLCAILCDWVRLGAIVHKIAKCNNVYLARSSRNIEYSNSTGQTLAFQGSVSKKRGPQGVRRDILGQQFLQVREIGLNFITIWPDMKDTLKPQYHRLVPSIISFGPLIRVIISHCFLAK
ncbi:hypothetical protein PHYBLDRAFT_175035, partial [Phycomyces blakesleeanus NRRL 1555(-)]